MVIIWNGFGGEVIQRIVKRRRWLAVRCSTDARVSDRVSSTTGNATVDEIVPRNTTANADAASVLTSVNFRLW